MTAAPFFKDSRAFEQLEGLLASIVAGKSPDEPIRVWVPCCGTGEDAYALAMVLNRILAGQQRRNRLEVFATDTDPSLLAWALQGVFSEAQLINLPSALRNSDFECPSEGKYLVKSSLRSSVVFATHDLLRDRPFRKLDLISCRHAHLLTQNGQPVSPGLFYEALNPGGLLLLHPSESLAVVPDRFEVFADVNLPYLRSNNPESSRPPASPFQAFETYPKKDGTGLKAMENRLASLSVLPEEARAELLTYISTLEHELVSARDQLSHYNGDANAKKVSQKALAESENKYKLLFYQSPLPMWIYDRETLRFVHVNKAAIAHYGYSAEEFKSMTLNDLLVDEPQKMKSQHFQPQAGLCTFNAVFRHKRKDGSVIDVKQATQKIELDDEKLQLALLSDVTDQFRILGQKDLSYAVFSQISQSTSFQEGLTKAAGKIRQVMAWDIAEVWLPDYDHSLLRLGSSSFEEGDESLALFAKESAEKSYLKGQSLPGLSWQRKESLWMEDIYAEDSFQRKDLAQRTRLRSAFTIPLWHQQELVAVFVFFSRLLLKEDSEIVIQLQLLASQIASEMKRRKTEEELNLFFELVPDFLCIIGLDGFAKKLNPTFEKVLGYSEAELKAEPLYRFVHPEDIGATKLEIAKLASGTSTIYVDNRYRCKDGSYRWLSWTLTSLPEEGTFFATARDITENKKNNDEIAGIKTAVDHTSDAIAISDATGKPIYHNRSYVEILGYTPEDLILLGGPQAIYYQPEILSSITESLTQEGRWSGNVQIRSIKDEVIDFYLRANTIRDRESQPIGYIFLFTDLRERKEAERQMQMYTSQITNILQSITDGFCMVNKDWTMAYANPAAEKLFTRKSEELIGKNIWEEFAPAVDTDFYPMFHQAMETQRSIRFQTYYPPYDLWLDVHAYPSEQALSFYFRDITNSRLLQHVTVIEKEALEMNLSGGYSLAQVTDFILKRMEEINPMLLCSVLMVSPDGTTLTHLSAPSLPREYVEAINGSKIGPTVGSCGAAAYLKEPVVVSDIASDPFWKDHKDFALKSGLKACSSYPVLSTSQRVVATFAVYYRQVRFPSPREITLIERTKNILGLLIENREAEESIRISNERYRLVLNVTNEAIWEWDALSDHRVWGEGFQLQFGYRSSEVQSLASWTSPIHPEDYDRIVQSFRAVIESDENHRWEAEYRYRKADQTYAYVYDRGLLLRNPEGKPVRMIGAMVDITERKENVLLLQQLNDSLEKRAQELAESNAELERFAYVASHDLQEPLRMVRSFLQLLQKKYQNQLDERAEEYIRYAVDGAETMKKLILDLLEYSRVGTNQEAHERVDLNEVLLYVVSLFERDIQDTEAHIQVPPLPVIRGNHSQLIQLFQNLLGNALKYRSNRPPRIAVRVEEEKEHWLFSVKDNGIGIDKAFFEKVFIIFQRLHNKNAYSGTGIGLAICKKIVERHGGKIWLDSIPGQETTFYLTIKK